MVLIKSGMHADNLGVAQAQIIALLFQIMKTLLIRHKNMQIRAILLIRQRLVALLFWNRTT